MSYVKSMRSVFLVLLIPIIMFCISCGNESVSDSDLKEIKTVKYSDSEQAKQYAIDIVCKKYPELNLDKFSIELSEFSENIWFFSASPKYKKYTKGGGGVILKFKKEDGTVIYLARQK